MTNFHKNTIDLTNWQAKKIIFFTFFVPRGTISIRMYKLKGPRHCGGKTRVYEERSDSCFFKVSSSFFKDISWRSASSL